MEGNNNDQRRNKSNRNLNKKKKISTTESQLFERVNKTTKPQTRLTKKKRERIQVNKVRNESEEIITDTTEIQKNGREYYCEGNRQEGQGSPNRGNRLQVSRHFFFLS